MKGLDCLHKEISVCDNSNKFNNFMIYIKYYI